LAAASSDVVVSGLVEPGSAESGSVLVLVVSMAGLLSSVSAMAIAAENCITVNSMARQRIRLRIFLFIFISFLLTIA
jgi:hypothetical protein